MTEEQRQKLWTEAEKQIAEVVEQYNLADERLTKMLTTKAIVQAIKAGDFIKQVRVVDNATDVIYIPYAQVEELRAENNWLREKLKSLGHEVNYYEQANCK
jgi:ssRNA-specific RNase YbeY (16S rRNA maturation enzyme)